MTFRLIFFFRLKKNMKIELTVHLGTLLTHTVHIYAQFHYHRFINTGVKKKRQAFRYEEMCRKLKVTPPPPWEQKIHLLVIGSSSCHFTQPIRVHQGCSLQANQSRRRGSIQWLQQDGAPSGQWENWPSHSLLR